MNAQISGMNKQIDVSLSLKLIIKLKNYKMKTHSPPTIDVYII